jgi:type I restriction enzyme S subunit
VNKYKIPIVWKWVILDNISITSSGGTPNRKNSNYFKGNIPWVKSGELNYNVITETDEYITQEALDYSSAKVFTKGSLLIALYGNTVGRMAFLGIDAATNQAIASITSFGINPKYLYYFLMYSKEELLNKREGSAQPNINQKVLNNFPFPLAPFEEQNRIVEKIEELYSELDKNLQQFNKSLIDVDNLWTLSLNKKINNKRILIKLGNLVDIKGGKRLPKNTNYSNHKTQYPYIRVTDFSNYSIDESNLKYINEEVYEELKNYSISSKDVYMSIAGTIGLVGFIPNSITNVILTENAAKLIISSTELIKKYLIYVLDSPFIKEQIAKSVKSTSQPKLALYKIAEIEIPKHSIIEQENIVEKLEELKINCDKLKSTINESILATINIKNKILQDAFQGKLSSQLDTDISIESLIKKIRNEKEKHIQEQQEIIKNRPKIKRMEKEKLSIIQVLEKNQKPISSKQLWEDSMYSGNIEKFYSELKKVHNRIKQEKSEKETLISLK